MSRVRALIRVSLILLIVQSVVCEWRPLGPGNELLCRSSECRSLGNEYKKNMNTGAQPCQDFYKFACGNWHRNHPGPKYASDWNLMEVMNVDFAKIIRNILETNNFKSDVDSIRRQAVKVYMTCVRIPEYPIKEVNDIAREIRKIGRYPTVPLWQIHKKYLELTGESAFFDFKVRASYPTEEIPVLMLTELTSAYGSIYHQPAWKPLEEKAYRELLIEIMKNLDFGTTAEMKKKIDKVFQFRRRLESILDQNEYRSPGKFNPLTVDELSKWFAGKSPKATYTQKINLMDIADVLLHTLPVETRRTRRVIAMRQERYFVDLINLLKEFPPEVLAYHMEIYFVERHLKFNPDMIKLLESTSMEPHDLLSYIRGKEKERWQLCIKNHNQVEVLDRMLYDKWFPKEYEDIIQEIIVNIKEAINRQMLDSNWLDESTYKYTLSTLYELEEWIGFPTWYKTGETPGERHSSMEILSPNAALYNAMNLLYIHAALLLPPIFHAKLPAIYNYAGLGSTIGHELYHVIDNCGSYAYGNTSIDWWEPGMREACLERMESFVEEYNVFTDREFKNRYQVNVNSDTKITLLENFPDVMGLDTAYRAYQILLAKDRSVCQVLPGFEKYTCDQMFYISFANTYCGYDTKKAALNKLRTWDHSIDSVRINAAVAQMESFGEAFRCRRGSSLHPFLKLNMWD